MRQAEEIRYLPQAVITMQAQNTKANEKYTFEKPVIIVVGVGLGVGDNVKTGYFCQKMSDSSAQLNWAM